MKLKDIFDKTDDAKKFIKKYYKSIVNYRLYDTLNNKSYIGSTDNLYSRLYNNKFGHVGSIYNDVRHDYIHLKIIEIGLDNFEFYIEKSGFSTIKDAEINEKLLIEKYDSFNNGYNLTIDGRGGNCGRIKVTNNTETINIKPNELNSYIEKGYHLGSNRIVVTNPLTNKFKRIISTKLDYYLSSGWILGNKNLNTTKGKISITNKITGETKKIFEKDLINYSKDWEKGFGPNKGTFYVYNPNTGENIRVSDLDHYINLGYKQGIIYRNGKYTMSLNNNCIKVDKNETRIYLDKGYKFGK